MLTPRRKLACRVCTRRKVKCDKQIPCNNCLKRGAAHECERDEPVEPPLHDRRGSHQYSVDESAALSALRNRVAELEAALQEKNTEENSIFSPQTNPGARDSVHLTRTPSPPRYDLEIEDAVTVLEFLAWGRMKDRDKARLSPEALRSPGRDERGRNSLSDVDVDILVDTGHTLLPWLQMLLPSRRQVTLLVEYHNSCLLWFHNSYFAPSFSRQLLSFYHDHNGDLESPELNLQWVALLFSILAGTLTSAPVHEATKWRFEEKEARLLSQKWYKAVIALLNAADYTANHCLFSVQAIATLTSTAHILGHSNSQSVMLASAVRIAQSLGLHRLNEDARGDEVDLETGRRVWEQLCTQDWFSTPFSETYAIHALHSTSLPPKNCNDDLVLLPDSVPAITGFCRFLAQIASIMPRLQDGMASSNTLYTKHDQVLLYDKKMRTLATDIRPPFLANTADDHGWPCYVPWARRAIAMSSAHKIIMIHRCAAYSLSSGLEANLRLRKFLSLSFTNPMFAFTRRTCLAASKTILKEYIAINDDESSPLFWTHQAFSVAACIIICLDLLHQDVIPGDPHLQLVTESIAILEASQERSLIASRGVHLLKALQKRVSATTNSRKRPAENDDSGATRKRQRVFDVSAFVHSFRSGLEAE